MSGNPILLEKDGAVAIITLNAPEKKNALSRSVINLLAGVIADVERDGSIRALLLRGEGRMFSCGGDIDEMVAAGDALSTLVDDELSVAESMIPQFASLPFPVVCAVQGAVAGGGLALALASDYLIAAHGTKFVAAHTGLGYPGDLGISWLLPRAVGGRRARDMILTNRAVTSDEALAWGLVEKVVPGESLLEEARRMAMQFSAGPTQGYAGAKRLQLAAFQGDLAASLRLEAAEMNRASKTADSLEAVRAFVEKRTPQFIGR
ncbi:MAG TPA: enoyl-CoA hydratase/isomerase family protein [Comamonadaceae bacterium]|nr:enoyl-CoA hydratase/isomerase family protein [Burkholderiaceae bacterium]OGB45649.1 MAG: enoyl-CoA hydratase [Burkholderiales bacterium RIFCSPLOWO2_12_FULL_65_40]HCE27698.1 enoyl-CoA hydratase/isomerase family protein [Comamonadaceae bacterium]